MIHPPRIVGAVTLLLALASCAPAPNTGGQSHSDQAMIAACRQRADESFERANRTSLYQPSSTRDSPYSAMPPSPTNDLADRFSYGSLYNDCIRSNGAAATPASVAPAATPPPAPATARSAPTPPPGQPLSVPPTTKP
jgi:hypothetical protein